MLGFVVLVGVVVFEVFDGGVFVFEEVVVKFYDG